MSKEIDVAENVCAFCGNPVTNSGETVMVTAAYKVMFNGTDSAEMEQIEDRVSQISHEDCWKGRNSFAPARRRVLQIGGTKE